MCHFNKSNNRNSISRSRFFYYHLLPCVSCHRGGSPGSIEMLFGFKYIPPCCRVESELTPSAPSTTDESTKLPDTTTSEFALETSSLSTSPANAASLATPTPAPAFLDKLQNTTSEHLIYITWWIKFANLLSNSFHIALYLC